MNSLKGNINKTYVILMSMALRVCLIYTLMECKVNLSLRKLFPMNSIKLNLNLVTKLKLLSIVNITKFDIYFVLSEKATS